MKCFFPLLAVLFAVHGAFAQTNTFPPGSGNARIGILDAPMEAAYPTFDYITGDGLNALPFNIGDPGSNIGTGATQPPSNKFTVNSNLSISNSYTNTAAPADGLLIQGNVLIDQSPQVNANYNLDVAGNVRANQITVNTISADLH